MVNDEKLRALIRLIPAARALEGQLEKSIHLEIYGGTGDMAIKSVTGLQSSIAEISQDSYVTSLSLDVHGNATDKEKVSLGLLVVTQLCAYLEGQTGLVGSGGSGKASHQYAPNVTMNAIQGLKPEQLDKLMDIASVASPKRKKHGEETNVKNGGAQH